MPVLKDLKSQINKTNAQLASQYRMMSSAHNRYIDTFQTDAQNTDNTSFYLTIISELFNYTSRYFTENSQTIYQI